MRQWGLLGILVFSLLLTCSQGWAALSPVHFFDCKECHRPGATINELGGDNICLRCHDLIAGDVMLNTGLNGHTDGRFSTGDASNAFGHGTGVPSAQQTSHNWAASTDVLEAAGAQAPIRSEHPEFYSRYGTSSGKLTCSRCHNPHGDATTNPKLLVKGDNSADIMCRACHRSWDQSDNHGWLTHPIVADYNASALAEPDKYNANLINKENAGIKLINGGVSCTSCHGVHFVDSDASTLDGSTELLSISDGKLLRGDGPNSSDKSSLCQTCHSYMEHGNNSGEKVGCLTCHSGHSYDPDLPNYFVLRKSADTTSFGTAIGIDYSSPSLVDPAQAESKYIFWANPGDASGYCERCHGEASSLPGSIHSAGAYCTDCHGHSQVDGGSFGHPGGGDCSVCHASDHVVDSGQANWVTIFDDTAGHSYEIGSVFTVDAYATCSMCHKTNLLPVHSNNCTVCHFGASPPRDSFSNWNQTCQQGSCHASYHDDASDAHQIEVDNSNCTKCHNQYGFDIPWTWDSHLPGFYATASACGKCHTLETDNTPPVTSSDIQPEPGYTGSALITLWANDAWGIQSIFYRLDGGTTQTYSGPITVAAPVNGSQSHTLEFWARDNSGYTETAKSGNFTISADTVPPVTTSDARAYYGADATIRLTATDNATSFPVAATYYIFDNPNGTPVMGTTAVFPEPASGPEVHTLYFWSVDHSGNEEVHNSVDFTMLTNGLEHTGMTMAPWVSGYADYYSNPDRVLADPTISYQVYIDGVPIGGPVTKQYDFYYHPYYGVIYPKMTQTWTSTWRCPSGMLVSAGDEVKIVFDARFNDRELWPIESEVPATYTFTLPAGAVQLEPTNWTISVVLDWKAFDYFMAWEGGDYGGHSSISILPSVENIAYVTSAADTTAPVTGSNAVSGKVYGKTQTFTLTPVDEAGGTGVESTWWQLDSTSGSWTKGTTVPVPAPSTIASTKAHTLYWYSQDHAGNQEAVNSVSFSIENLRTFTTTLPLDQVVWYQAIPDDASGPWVGYTIKLDGTTLGSTFYATQYSYYNQKFNHLIGETNITGAGQIDIIVTAGVTTPGSSANNTNAPQTFTLNLPAEATRLLYKGWTGFPNYNWTPHDYYYNSGPPVVQYPYSNLQLPTATIGNIGYQSAGSATDTSPPVTTIDAVEGTTYSGNQTFTLVATDATSSVESTWWQLDGSGLWNIGTSVPVTAPTSGTVSHTITWFSRDNVANQETTQSVTFDVIP